MTTQTKATDRLAVVPSVEEVEAALRALPYMSAHEARRSAQHLHGNLWPNADAMTKAELVNLLHAAVNDVERMDENGDAIMPRATYNALAKAYEKARRTL